MVFYYIFSLVIFIFSGAMVVTTSGTSLRLKYKIHWVLCSWGCDHYSRGENKRHRTKNTSWRDLGGAKRRRLAENSTFPYFHHLFWLQKRIVMKFGKCIIFLPSLLSFTNLTSSHLIFSWALGPTNFPSAFSSLKRKGESSRRKCGWKSWSKRSER